jgi:RimJ/RimL family protein N-acetyltransferase
VSALPHFHTARLYLRPLIAADVELLYHLIYADPVVRRWFASASSYGEVHRLHAAKVRHNEGAGHAGFGYWAVLLHATGQLAGQVLLGPPEPMPWIELDPSSPAYPLDREVELGYAFGQAYWGQGYATEACHTIVRYAFSALGLHRLVNSVRRENDRSLRLLRRLGFRLETNSADPALLVAVLDRPMRPLARDSGAG